MRTTISIDDDVLLAVKERAQREKRTAGEVLSELARAALTGTQTKLRKGNFGFVPLPHRGKAVSNALIDAMRQDEPA